MNSAGYGSLGAVEDIELDEARKQFEVNLFGLSEMIKAVLPTMRAQRSGTIVNVSSISGRLPSVNTSRLNYNNFDTKLFKL